MRGITIDKRRFPRSDITRQQGIVAIQMKGPHLLMKGSPIQDFQAIKPVAKGDCRVVKGRRIGQFSYVHAGRTSSRLILGTVIAIGSQATLKTVKPLCIHKGLNNAEHLENFEVACGLQFPKEAHVL